MIESFPADLLWRHSLAVIPLVLLIAVLCRSIPCRPATRHSLWLLALAFFAAAPLLSLVRRAEQPLVRSPEAALVPDPLAAAWPSPDQDEADRLPLATPGHPSPARLAGAEAAHTARPAPAVSALRSLPPIAIPAAEFALPPMKSHEPAQRQPHRQPLLVAVAPSAAEPPAAAPMPVAEPPPAPGAALVTAAEDRADVATATGSWDLWRQRLLEAREVLIGLPTIPAAAWLGGAIFVALLLTARAAWTLRWMSRGTPAPAEVVRVVADAAAALRLRSCPATLMIDARVCPMVWCGSHPRLIMPRSLWEQLDDAGRRAVVFHELAHLRRRDHWVAWAEMVVGCLYWWHPLVWWVRRHLREEADLSCDAWVTALMPGARRAYAQALLETRSFIDVLRPAGPVVGLGAASSRTRRFARRLTMVMTEQKAPRLSFRGAALACCVAVAGYLFTPALACPPEKKDEAGTPKPAKAPKPPRAPRAAKVPRTPGAAAVAPRAPMPAATPRPGRPAEAAPEPDETTFERFMRDREDGGDLEERIRNLEEQIERLYRRLEELMEQRGGDRSPRGMVAPMAPMSGVDAFLVPGFEVNIDPVVPGLEVNIDPLVPGLDVNIDPLVPGVSCNPLVPGFNAAAMPLPGAFAVMSQPDGETITHVYRFSSQGKLDDFVALMARDDVPVLVRPVEDGVEVQATAGQHHACRAFCVMIDGKECARGYALPEGKLEALTKLMLRSDVPILVRPAEGSLEVNGTDLEHSVFGVFVNLIQPGAVPGEGYVQAHAHGAGHASGHGRSVTGARAAAYEARAVAEAQAHALHEHIRALEHQIQALEHQAEHIDEQSSELEEKAADLEAQAQEIEESAADASGNRRSQLLLKAQGLIAQAKALNDQAAHIAAQAEAVREQAVSIEEQRDRIEERIGDLEEWAEEAEQADEADGDEDDEEEEAGEEGEEAEDDDDPALTVR